MTVLGIIPARGGSKKLPRKNILPLHGKPLIAWTIEAALATKRITSVLVSSDDSEILAVAAEFGATPVLRPAELAQDASPTLPVLQHAVQWAEWAEETEYDIIAHLPCTNPLKTAEDIDAGLDMLLADKDLHSVIGVCEIPSHHPLRVKRIVNGYIRDWDRPEPAAGQRQLLEPKAYIRNGAFYLVRRGELMGKHGKLFGHNWSKAFIMPPERSVNIDDAVDMKLCEVLLGER
jgi:CMP-N-acetylneuraminic acid synthetase